VKGQELLARAARLASAFEGGTYAIAGDAARCLWMLEALPGGSVDVWTRLCHPWPRVIEVVGVEGELPAGAVQDSSGIAREFGPAMLAQRHLAALPGCVVPLAAPPFVLAEILLEDDVLKATRIADLMRVLEMGGRPVDIEDVRVLLKAVRAGETFALLAEVAAVI